MAKLDYEKLLGGYATGILTVAECEVLFGAALHDQALFNALADEQALKELLDDPESRRRLILALEASEGTREKSGRWGALVPAWLPLPSSAQQVRTEQDGVFTSFRQSQPKTRSWRGVVAGGLILGALAVIVAAGLIEEMMSPPQPVLTADARRTEQAAPSAPLSAPGDSGAPSSSPSAPSALEPSTAPSPSPSPDKIGDRDQPSDVFEKTVEKKEMEKRPLRDRARRPETSRSERRRTQETAEPSPPIAATAMDPQEQVELKQEQRAEPGPIPVPIHPRTSAGPEPSPLVSARAAFYAGSGSLESSGEVSPRTSSMAERREESQQVAALRALEQSGRAKMPASVSPMIPSPVRPLGMRYSLVKKSAGGTDQEVSATTMFNADDETRLAIEVNTAGYLYVLKRTLPEVWTVLYPSLGTAADPAGRAAYVHSGTRYVIPSTGSLTGAVERGPFQLAILFTKEPQAELGSFGTELPERAMVQSRRISDLIRRVRTEVASGKILIERAEPGTAEIQAEHAMYVVDRSAVPLRKLLADVMLSFR